MGKRLLSLVLVTTMVLGMTLTVSAATSKEGTEVTGLAVLDYVATNVPTYEEMEQNGVEAEVAVVIQTRAIAKLPRHGFMTVNYGAILSQSGVADDGLPPLTTAKKNVKKGSWKYITSVSPALFMQEYTNTNEEYGIYQKKGEYDAFEKQTVYYGAIGKEGKKQLTGTVVAGLTDKANAQYIDPEATFYSYDIMDPETEEVIGKMFIEKKKPSAKPEKEVRKTINKEAKPKTK